SSGRRASRSGRRSPRGSRAGIRGRPPGPADYTTGSESGAAVARNSSPWCRRSTPFNALPCSSTTVHFLQNPPGVVVGDAAVVEVMILLKGLDRGRQGVAGPGIVIAIAV